VESKAECVQLNLAHHTRSQKNMKKKLKQMPVSTQYKSDIHEGSPEGIRRLWRKGFVKEMRFKSGVKDRGSDR